MGADAEVYLFDYRRYRAEVVPGLVDLMRGGQIAPWLMGLLQRPGDGWDGWTSVLVPYLRSRPTDLARFCRYLGEDLRFPDNAQGNGRLAPAFRPCGSTDCPTRDRCPLHGVCDQGVSEAMNTLFEAAVVACCLGPSQFVGRSMNPLHYQPLLNELGVHPHDPVRGLLAALSLRGGVFGYGLSNGDGIHGWLTVEETAALATHLERLPLPRYEPTFAAMTAHRRRSVQGHVFYPADSFPQLSLSFVRTTATIAAERGLAVLWGNDLLTTPS